MTVKAVNIIAFGTPVKVMVCDTVYTSPYDQRVSEREGTKDIADKACAMTHYHPSRFKFGLEMVDKNGQQICMSYWVADALDRHEQPWHLNERAGIAA